MIAMISRTSVNNFKAKVKSERQKYNKNIKIQNNQKC